MNDVWTVDYRRGENTVDNRRQNNQCGIGDQVTADLLLVEFGHHLQFGLSFVHDRT